MALHSRHVYRRKKVALAVTLALLSLQLAEVSLAADQPSKQVQQEESSQKNEAVPVLAPVVVQAATVRTVVPTRPVSSVYGTETTVVDTPRTVSEISAEQLARDSIRNADDLVKYAPGVTRNGGQNVSVAPLIRGQNSELFQDGQRTYNVRHPFNINAFEGVDIVSGPPPQVFGTSSRSGGYANYLTKKPDFEKQRTEISGQLGTWVPGGGSFDSYRLTLDTTGPISDTLAYRVSLTPQRAGDYAKNVSNNFNAAYGALAWKPSARLRVDWNAAYDDYYDFNVTHGWNRATQQLVDSSLYYGGRATPIISVGAGAATQYYSPVFASGAYNSAVIGWQRRTPAINANGVRQFIAGPVLAAAAQPSFLTNPATPGTVRGWVYDPSIPGNGLVPLSDSAYSRPQDQNTAKRGTTQLRVAYEASPDWTIVNSTLYQYSKDKTDAVGSFLAQYTDKLFENRLELRGRHSYEFFGAKIDHDSNTGTTFRRESYITKAANNSFTTHPYDLTAPLDLKTPATLFGLPAPAGSGSWVGTAGVPQLSAYYGYLNLPAMYPVENGLYAERGGSPGAGGAVYTSDGNWTNISLFTQQNFLFNERYGINIGASATHLSAKIHNPVFLTPAQEISDKKSLWLPAVQLSLIYKPTANSSIYTTYDRSYSLNTGGFADVLTWGGTGNTLDQKNFRSLSRLLEVGGKFEPIPNKLFASLAVYRQERDQAPLTNGSVPRLEVKGLDSSLRFQATSNLSTGVNYSIIKGTYSFISFPAGFFSPWGFVADNATVFSDGNALNQRPAPGTADAPGIPKHNVNAFIDYKFGNGYGAELSGWWTSGWYTSLAKNVKIPSSYNLNLTLYYHQPKWDAALRIINLTDERTYVNGLAGPTTEFVQPGLPRALQATFAYRF